MDSVVVTLASGSPTVIELEASTDVPAAVELNSVLIVNPSGSGSPAARYVWTMLPALHM